MGYARPAEQLVREFANNVAAQSEAIMAGDARTGNQHAKRYIKARKELFSQGDEGREALCAFLTHSRPDVRAMAACYLLRYKHTQAMEVLREVSRMPGLAGFGAGECIKRWEEGAWELDPED